MPAGARRVRTGPAVLAAGTVLGTPEVSTLVTRTQFWSVPLPFPAAAAWVRTHPPVGLTYSDYGTGSGPDGPSRTYGWSDPPSASWSSAQLEYGVAPSGAGSVIRLDALVVWLDPRPLLDDQTGPRLRVTVAAGCPARDAGIVGVRNHDGELTDRLLPAGTPTGGLICRYFGGNGRPFALRRQTRLDAAAGQLARLVDGLPLSHAEPPVLYGGMADGSAAVVALSYRGRPDADLWVSLDGCDGFVANGSIETKPGGLERLIETYG
ncbi:MAG TPA: hypothetical protein VNE21_02430 [Mycobacteriales bacterium]|nr:hypothetical protein [Mycobacteriales bacterium]